MPSWLSSSLDKGNNRKIDSQKIEGRGVGQRVSGLQVVQDRWSNWLLDLKMKIAWIGFELVTVCPGPSHLIT